MVKLEARQSKAVAETIGLIFAEREIIMKSIKTLMLAGTFLALGSGTAFAEELNIGEREYQSRCAVCHGKTGTGDGPMAIYLAPKLPNLRALSSNNGGVFPFDRVYRVIDGREEVKAHGSKGMRVWGNEYNDEAVEYYSFYLSLRDAKSYVRGRILALVTYVFDLQDK